VTALSAGAEAPILVVDGDGPTREDDPHPVRAEERGVSNAATQRRTGCDARHPSPPGAGAHLATYVEFIEPPESSLEGTCAQFRRFRIYRRLARQDAEKALAKMEPGIEAALVPIRGVRGKAR